MHCIHWDRAGSHKWRIPDGQQEPTCSVTGPLGRSSSSSITAYKYPASLMLSQAGVLHQARAVPGTEELAFPTCFFQPGLSSCNCSVSPAHLCFPKTPRVLPTHHCIGLNESLLQLTGFLPAALAAQVLQLAQRSPQDVGEGTDPPRSTWGHASKLAVSSACSTQPLPLASLQCSHASNLCPW